LHCCDLLRKDWSYVFVLILGNIPTFGLSTVPSFLFIYSYYNARLSELLCLTEVIILWAKRRAKNCNIAMQMPPPIQAQGIWTAEVVFSKFILICQNYQTGVATGTATGSRPVWLPAPDRYVGRYGDRSVKTPSDWSAMHTEQSAVNKIWLKLTQTLDLIVQVPPSLL
jgi:hypothetical protein